MIVEGQKVSYVGDDFVLPVGTIGKVVALAGSGAHVQWPDGRVELTHLDDLVPWRTEHTGAVGARVATEFDATLDMVTTASLQVRAVYDEHGESGLVNALAESGHIAACSEYAEEAIGVLAGRIRQDPHFAEVLAALEADEADSLVTRVASTVLTDSLSEED